MQQVVNFQAIWIGWTIRDLSCMFPTEQSRICLVCLLPFLLTSQHCQRSKCWDVAICWKPFFHFYATWQERRKRFQNIQKDNLNMASLLFSRRLSHRKFCRCRPPEVGLFACFLCWTNKQILLSNSRLLAFPFLLLLPLFLWFVLWCCFSWRHQEQHATATFCTEALHCSDFPHRFNYDLPSTTTNLLLFVISGPIEIIFPVVYMMFQF